MTEIGSIMIFLVPKQDQVNLMTKMTGIQAFMLYTGATASYCFHCITHLWKVTALLPNSISDITMNDELAYIKSSNTLTNSSTFC